LGLVFLERLFGGGAGFKRQPGLVGVQDQHFLADGEAETLGPGLFGAGAAVGDGGEQDERRGDCADFSECAIHGSGS
jgi:hypothetical protein